MHCGNVLMDNQLKYNRHRLEFARIFKAKLSEYFDLMLGFDLAKLGAHIGADTFPNVNRFIEEKYGPEARMMIEDLMEERCIM